MNWRRVYVRVWVLLWLAALAALWLNVPPDQDRWLGTLILSVVVGLVCLCQSMLIGGLLLLADYLTRR